MMTKKARGMRLLLSIALLLTILIVLALMQPHKPETGVKQPADTGQVTVPQTADTADTTSCQSATGHCGCRGQSAKTSCKCCQCR